MVISEIVKAVDGKLLCGDDTLTIDSLCTDSREAKKGSLFVPIVGERVDAHRFIKSVFEAGTTACFASDEAYCSDLADNACVILVDNTLTALQKTGSFYRDQFDIKILGVTGSVGKTTTKEMISAALTTKFNVLKTIGNMNSQVGLPLMMFHINSTHQIGVIEMGMSEPDEMSRLSKISKPDMAIITNIGVSHIGNLGSQVNIRREKLNIINEIDEGGILFLNGDDPLLKELKTNPSNVLMTEDTAAAIKKAELVLFGTNEDCTYRATNITYEDGHTFFTLNYPEGTEDIELRVLGEHNVLNALAALAIAHRQGIAPSIARQGLYDYSPIAMRGGIIEKNGVKIIDDTYNASPDSMKSGINVLCSIDNVKRRIAILADVLELGDISYECHYDVGKYIATREGISVDYTLTCGKEARAIATAIQDNNNDIHTLSFESNEELISYLKDFVREGDAILVKGSRGMHMEEIINSFK